MTVQRVGGEILVNATPSDAGGSVSVAGHADGSFFVSWQGPDAPFSQDGPRYISEILGRAYAYERPLGRDVVVNTQRLDPQVSPSAAARPDGSYVIAYSSGDDDQLGGTYVATQALDHFGRKISPEIFSNQSYYHFNPDITAAPGGGSFVVSEGEDVVDLQVQAQDGSIVKAFSFGAPASPFGHVAIVNLSDTSAVGFWEGKSTIDAPDDDPRGLYAATVSAGGSVGPSVLVAQPGDAATAIFDVSRLADGRLAVAWSTSDEAGLASVGSIYLSIFDPQSGIVSAAQAVSGPVGPSEHQSDPSVATLLDGRLVVTWVEGAATTSDPSGASIQARVFSATGAPLGDAFQVNTVTQGDQIAPSVSALGDRFVVAWQGPDGVKAQIFDPDSLGAKSSGLYVRAGTQDGSAAGGQTLTGPDYANTFFIDSAAASGADRISNFQKHDILATSKMLFDSNRDGLITFGSGGLHLDGPNSSDVVTLSGFSGSVGLRYLGVQDGAYAYADASVRPRGAIEGTLGNDALRGDAGDQTTDVFFYDTALGLSLGSDAITRFGGHDLLVTTSPIFDSNGDGRIGLAANHRLDLPTSLGGPDDVFADSGAGGSVSLTDPSGHEASTLAFVGSVAHSGVTYYAYGLIGGTATIADLHFG